MTIRSRLLFLLLPPLIVFLLLSSFFFYFDWSKEFLIIGLSVLFLLVIGTVFVIADRISKPVRQLNQAALDIAAGDYESNIQVNGPKEIIELAQTLNTMSQCLVEHMSRLRESSLIRERMHGEYECALLLQYYMLQKVIDEFNQPQINMRLISVPGSPLQRGLSLIINLNNPDNLKFTLFEADELGFFGLYKLNQLAHMPLEQLNDKSFIHCQFIDQFRLLRYYANHLCPPLIWSLSEQKFVLSDLSDEWQEVELQNRDMIFLYNSSLAEHFETREAIEKWFARVLRHFADDGIEAIRLMLTNELTFLTKKQHVKHNYRIISLQMNNHA